MMGIIFITSTKRTEIVSTKETCISPKATHTTSTKPLVISPTKGSDISTTKATDISQTQASYIFVFIIKLSIIFTNIYYIIFIYFINKIETNGSCIKFYSKKFS